MVYALDLSPRQSARTLEQAFRHRAIIVLEPRTWLQGETLTGRFEPGDGKADPALLLVAVPGEPPPASENLLAVAPPINPETIDKAAGLIGTYCDAMVYLGENRYLFSSDIIRVETTPGVLGARLEMSRPKTVQVGQRRRYWRFRPARSSQIDLRWGQPGQPPGYAAAWLCNISAEGLACRCHGRVGEQLWIGDPLTAEFTLSPEDPRRYAMDAVLCSKTPAGSPDKLILGLQFLIGAGHEATERSAALLREQLLTAFHPSPNAPRGADR